MPKKPTTNTTLMRLKNTPFESATAMKAEEQRILKQEWENVERARVRRVLLKKEENQEDIRCIACKGEAQRGPHKRSGARGC